MKTFYFKLLQIFEHPYAVNKFKCHMHAQRRQFLIMIEKDHLQIRENGEAKK